MGVAVGSAESSESEAGLGDEGGDGDSDMPIVDLAGGEYLNPFCEDGDEEWPPVSVGNAVAQVELVDASGELRNLCEWGGTPLLIDICAVWCGPCHDLAMQLSDPSAGSWFPESIVAALLALLDEEKAYWVTVLVQGQGGEPATVDDALYWETEYPHPSVTPTFVPADAGVLESHFGVGCYPTIYSADHEFVWLGIGDCQTHNSVTVLLEIYG
jgi:hypothetical protein